MYWNMASHLLRVGFCDALMTDSVLFPTAYDLVQNRQ